MGPKIAASHCRHGATTKIKFYYFAAILTWRHLLGQEWFSHCNDTPFTTASGKIKKSDWSGSYELRVRCTCFVSPGFLFTVPNANAPLHTFTHFTLIVVCDFYLFLFFSDFFSLSLLLFSFQFGAQNEITLKLRLWGREIPRTQIKQYRLCYRSSERIMFVCAFNTHHSHDRRIRCTHFGWGHGGWMASGAK